MVDSDAIAFVDDLIEEYLLFRGFAGTLRQFQADKKNDKLKGFQVRMLCGGRWLDEKLFA